MRENWKMALVGVTAAPLPLEVFACWLLPGRCVTMTC